LSYGRSVLDFTELVLLRGMTDRVAAEPTRLIGDEWRGGLFKAVPSI
jgi:hypothetical protein